MDTIAGHDDRAGYAWNEDADGVVTVTMDDPDRAVNTMNPHFVTAFEATLDRLEGERDRIAGVILASAKESWFAGGDLELLRAADPARAAEEAARVAHMKSLLRRLERLGKPVVAALSGSALGGGLEVALAAHRRIAAGDAKGARFGFPEVSLGLLPGGGGIVRTVRMLGVRKALAEVILPASRFGAEEALAVGLVDEVVPAASLRDRAKAWIAANPAPAKPWDEEGFRLPGGTPASPSLAGALPVMPALLRAQLMGAPVPAPRAAMAAAVEGASVDIETASVIETRYFVGLTHSPVAKSMIAAFFDRREVEAGTSRPAGVPRLVATRVRVAGDEAATAVFAAAATRSGIEVVDEGAAGGPAGPADVDLVIRALPAWTSAGAEQHESEAVGLRLCAPREGVTLAEVVRGERTSHDAVARAFDLARQLRAVPIVVNGGGSFVARIVDAYLAEAVAAVGEGVEPATVEQAALQAGYAAGALRFLDELTLPRARALRRQAEEEGAGSRRAAHPADEVLDWMLAQGRSGRAAGGGFYDDDESGRRGRLWPGLRARYRAGHATLSFADLRERLLFAGALAATRCLDRGVLGSVAEANVGSVHGAGFPAWTGGALRYVDQHDGALAGFVMRADELADRYGERFRPPASLREKAADGERSVREA